MANPLLLTLCLALLVTSVAGFGMQPNGTIRASRAPTTARTHRPAPAYKTRKPTVPHVSCDYCCRCQRGSGGHTKTLATCISMKACKSGATPSGNSGSTGTGGGGGGGDSAKCSMCVSSHARSQCEAIGACGSAGSCTISSACTKCINNDFTKTECTGYGIDCSCTTGGGGGGGAGSVDGSVDAPPPPTRRPTRYPTWATRYPPTRRPTTGPPPPASTGGSSSNGFTQANQFNHMMCPTAYRLNYNNPVMRQPPFNATSRANAKWALREAMNACQNYNIQYCGDEVIGHKIAPRHIKDWQRKYGRLNRWKSHFSAWMSKCQHSHCTGVYDAGNRGGSTTQAVGPFYICGFYSATLPTMRPKGQSLDTYEKTYPRGSFVPGPGTTYNAYSRLWNPFLTGGTTATQSSFSAHRRHH